MMKSPPRKVIISLLLIFVLAACDKVFEYTPYSANVRSDRLDTHRKSLDAVQKVEAGWPHDKPFRIALVADSHNYYKDFDDAMEAISSDDEITFVLHAGDLTYYGILKEFEIFHDIMEKADKPYFTVIGNHDFVANGKTIYELMFGELNYYFVFRNSKFIFFNNNIWENNNTEPDFFWLEDALSDSHNYDHTLVIAHIPPWGDQFTPLYENVYKQMMRDYNVSLSVHGHQHSHQFGEKYGDGIPYLVVGSPDRRGYMAIDIYNDSLAINRIMY